MLNATDIEKALSEDKDMQEGLSKFNEIDEKANAVAEEITKAMVDNIVKEESDFNLSTAILGVAKSLTQLSSFMYDSEEEFLTAIKRARELVVSDVVPMLVDPQPCGMCESCKNGKPEECINPTINTENTQSRFLPMLCGMLIEYDLFNKVLHMYTAGKENNNKEVNDNGSN